MVNLVNQLLNKLVKKKVNAPDCEISEHINPCKTPTGQYVIFFVITLGRSISIFILFNSSTATAIVAVRSGLQVIDTHIEFPHFLFI